MLTTPNFASILEESPSEITFPPPLPIGTYLCTVGQFENTKPSKAGNAGIKFPLKPISAMEDVDAEALQELGGLEGKSLSTTFWITPDSIGFLDQFHANCGIDLSDGTSRKYRNSEVQGMQVLALVSHRMNEENTRAFAEVKSTALAE